MILRNKCFSGLIFFYCDNFWKEIFITANYTYTGLTICQKCYFLLLPGGNLLSFSPLFRFLLLLCGGASSSSPQCPNTQRNSRPSLWLPSEPTGHLFLSQGLASPLQ